MNIGSLYLVKKWSWLLFPTKETASEAPSSACTFEAAWYSKSFNCEVTYFCLDSIVVFLEEDGFLKKVLTSDGKIGWTWFTEEYNEYFEELNKHLIG